MIEILSESGHLQVTGTGGIGYGLSATGAVTLTSDAQNHPQPMVIGSVSVTGQNPVLTYKANGRINVERVSVSGSTFTFNLRAQSSGSIGVQYWIFDSAAQSIKDPTMAGIVAEFRDEFGVVTFDATMAAMRVAEAVETPKTANEIPFGRFIDLSDTQTITVPAGKVYAISQATPSFVNTTYDQGGYSNSQNKPDTVVLDPEDDPNQGSFNWRQQVLQYYHSTGGYTSANTIEVGLTRFEYFDLGWRPAYDQPSINVYGQARHLIVDVTNFTAAAPINPTQINVGVNATSRSVTTGGASTISQSVTPSVTASASGGSGSYSYLWQFISGASEVLANGAANGASFSTSTANQPQGSTRSAIWRCRATDTNGVVGYGPDVTFSHVAEAFSVDVTPDPFSIANFAPNSAAETAYGTPRVFQITGINQAISLRLTRSASTSSPNISLNQLKLRTGPSSSGPWSDVGILYGNGQIDFTASNGAWFELTIEIRTQAGRGTAQYNAEITNLTTGGNSLAAFNFNGVVDNDDNYNNVDVIADWINLPTIDAAVNENDYSWSTAWYGEHYVTGINAPITLRFERYNYSGNFDALYIDCFTWPPGASGWTHHGYFNAHINDGNYWYLDVSNVVNGTRVAMNLHAISNSGRRSGQVDIVIHNNTGGHQIAGATQRLVVDNDNNYNVADYSANPITLNDQSASSNDPSAYTGGTFFQVTGINAPITLRFTRDSLTQSGNVFTRRTIIGRSTNGGASYSEYNLGAAAGMVVDLTANNGDWFFIKGYADTTAGSASAQWRNHVTNLTTGEYMGSAWIYMTVDADNNYNTTVDQTPDQINFAGVSGSTFDQFNTSITRSSNTYYMTGFGAGITTRIYLGYSQHNFYESSSGGGGGPIMVGDGPQSGSINLDIYRNGQYVGSLSHYVYGYYSGSDQYTWRDDITFNPNDSIRFDITVTGDMSEYTSALTASAVGSVVVDNLTAGGRIGQFAYNLQVNKQSQNGGGWG